MGKGLAALFRAGILPPPPTTILLLYYYTISDQNIEVDRFAPTNKPLELYELAGKVFYETPFMLYFIPII
jgi:hypothetical protein